MPSVTVWVFLLFATFFAAVHRVATMASLYWYYPWFDVVMHFWGGILVALGVVALSSLRVTHLKPTLRTTLLVLFIAMVSWEIFERIVGLYSPETYIFDTSKDLLVGFLGGITGFILFHKRSKKI